MYIFPNSIRGCYFRRCTMLAVEAEERLTMLVKVICWQGSRGISSATLCGRKKYPDNERSCLDERRKRSVGTDDGNELSVAAVC